MKKIGIMQPYLFPYIGYFQLINAVDEYVIYDDVNYIKNGWINRNNILISGKKSLFTIILSSTSPNRLIGELNVVDDFSKFKKTLSMVYSKAPYRNEALDIIFNICDYEDRNLPRFIGNSFKEIMRYLDVDTKMIYSSSLDKDQSLKGASKVIAICKKLEAKVYINAIGGQNLYNKNEFSENDIDLKFLKTNEIQYQQFKNQFVADLSIIDVMMFNSPQQIRRMLENYELR